MRSAKIGVQSNLDLVFFIPPNEHEGDSLLELFNVQLDLLRVQHLPSFLILPWRPLFVPMIFL